VVKHRMLLCSGPSSTLIEPSRIGVVVLPLGLPFPILPSCQFTTNYD